MISTNGSSSTLILAKGELAMSHQVRRKTDKRGFVSFGSEWSGRLKTRFWR